MSPANIRTSPAAASGCFHETPDEDQMRIVFSYFLIVKLFNHRTYFLKLIPFSVCDYLLDDILAYFISIRKFHLTTDVIALHISIRIRGNLYVVGFL